VVQFPEPEPELELVEEETPHDDVVFDLKPDLVQLPEAVTSGDAGVSGLESELGALQETARRADELAATVERRIDELKSGADERTAQVEADLTAAQRRVEELEAQVSGVDTLAEELRATTAKLEEVNRVLEGSVR
jgi:predicted RNase H-like nuclease (RuvC/YqgF family)